MRQAWSKSPELGEKPMSEAEPGRLPWSRRAAARRPIVLALGGLGIGLLSVGHSEPLLVYNATASAPVGFYRVLPPSPLRQGDLVLAGTPASLRLLAAERGYVPATVPLVKRVAALCGETVCAVSHSITIDGRHVADQLLVDHLGRALPAWSGCRTLDRGEVFLLMEGVPDSFDGRYFGPVPMSAIIGKLTPLWLR
jgi:conjugative transfer signal peptidase TraF